MTTGIRTATALATTTPAGIRGVPRLPNPNTPGWGATPSYTNRWDAAYNAVAVGSAVGTFADPVGGLTLTPIVNTSSAQLLQQSGNVLYITDTSSSAAYGSYPATVPSATLAGSFTVVSVYRPNTAGSMFGLGVDLNNRIYFATYNGNWLLQTVVGGTAKAITTTIAADSSKFAVLIAVVNGASSVFSVNGVDVAGSLTNPGTVNWGAYIGNAYPGGVGSYVRPQFATAAIYNGALTQAQRNMVNTALRQRYGL